MLFLFLICHDDTFAAPDSMGPDTAAWVNGLERRAGGRVQRPAEATVIQVRDGERIVQPGPRTNEPEYVAGFDVLEFATVEEAVEAAAAHPMTPLGTIEIRQIFS
ncbi:YciI family protein [Solirubrobacter taibaiensis]|nr:YciI family protein [Solirubrobacter taibaiensis]